MEQYNYYSAVKDDVKNAIQEWVETYDFDDFTTVDDFHDRLYDDLFVDDSVTGNASGSYFFSSYKAEEALCHNLDLLGEALEAFGSDADYLKNGPEACDVTIRCYLLGQILDEMYDALENIFYDKSLECEMDNIASYMDDDIRESIHSHTDDPIEFLKMYIEKDPSFKDLLSDEYPEILSMVDNEKEVK